MPPETAKASPPEPSSTKAPLTKQASVSSANNLADPILLGKIDKLFACGVGDYIALPQIVVVGDQSSGKSSVLEGLTNLPFPRDSGLCTRFATQITFRRAQESSVTISILPAKGASPEHVAETQAWSKVDRNMFDAKSFSTIMTEVHTLMGLGDQNSGGSKGTFSEVVLRLEICGPEQEHFAVIDVPGIFRKTTEGVTTNEDRALVRSMVHRYMENPRSVMLAVVPANVDIATQEILTMAEEVDENGDRTLGVLTKPDLVDKGGERPVMDLIEGKRHKLSLGWCLVRNPGQLQLGDASTNRNSIERVFFETEAPWNTLDKEKVGIAALRVRLQEILAAHIRKEFPKVKAEIHRKLITSKQALEKLGGRRETTAQQNEFLVAISMRFQEVTSLALNANYVGSDWFDQFPSLRFATAVVNRNDMLARVIDRFGHSYDLNADTSESGPQVNGPEEGYPAPSDDPDPMETGHSKESQGEVARSRTTIGHPDLIDLTVEQENYTTNVKSNTREWLTAVYRSSRGFELGTFDASILAMTMKTQSSKWEAIALGYISDVVNMAHMFVLKLLELLCPNPRICDELMSVLHEELMTTYKKACDHAKFLLRVERTNVPVTLNHYFNENLEKSRQARRRAALATKTIELKGGSQVVRLDDVVETHSMSNKEHIVRDLHDILKAYYKVARKRFVDNLCMQASNYFLVTGPDAPLKLFNPTFVSRLTAEQLEEIAGEDAAVKRRRKVLGKEIQNLEAGKKILT